MNVAKVRHTVAGRPRRTAALSALALVSLLVVGAGVARAEDGSGGGSQGGAGARWRAQLPVDREGSVVQGPVEVSVRVNGRATSLYQKADVEARSYLEAKEAASYDVTVRNLTGDRVGFVIAVDGLNAINGLASHLGPDEPMYVLDPYASTTVKGWRKDLGNVSKFVFVDERESYAARTDQANGDLGWVRVVAFHEYHPVVVRTPPPSLHWGQLKGQYRDGGSGGNDVAPEAEGAPGRTDAPPPVARREDAPSPGTGWGDNQTDRVSEVEFRPERAAAAQVILRYEYRDALHRLGILPWRERGRDRLWERENGQLGFAPPPTHW